MTTTSWWWRLVAVAVFLATASGAGWIARPQHADADTGTVVWGARVAPRTGQTDNTAVSDLERAIGEHLRAVRVFASWDTDFPDANDTWLRSTDHLLVYSIKPRRADGQIIPWASIAASSPGSQLYSEMETWADHLRAHGDPIYVILHHEPEAASNAAYGEPADFVAAWRTFVSVVRERGATNVRFLWTMTDYSFTVDSTDRRYAPAWYPGDDVVDGIGADSYNWYRCRGHDEGWRSLQEMIDPFRQFGALHPGKELWLPEVGSVEDPAVPGRKAQWIADASVLLEQPGWGQFRGLLYFHHEHDNTQHPACDWWVDSSPSSIAAFATMGADAYFGATVPRPSPGAVSATVGVATPAERARRITK
jgi:hypothetical protein